MNDTQTSQACRCNDCPGTGCNCGCQAKPAQPSCACGPQCRCGPACACTKS
ncbi:MAG: hypothetical protein GXC94_07755 [Comamonadaceae bacterium]|nr:hypothetical protein [Comamonadaceae bacterium]